MSTQLPDFSQPYVSDDERAADVSRLLDSDRRIGELMALAESPSSTWPRTRFDETKRRPLRDDEDVAALLHLWARTFADEIRIVHDARNRLVHGIRLSDRELRGAAWMAERLLDLTFTSSSSWG